MEFILKNLSRGIREKNVCFNFHILFSRNIKKNIYSYKMRSAGSKYIFLRENI